jgi:hypothetical protein
MGMTRRRMLAAIPAAIALAGAKVFGHGDPAQAADGDALILGQMNSAGTPTQLSSAALNGTFLVRNVYHGALEGTGMVGTTGQGVAEAGSIGVLALGVQHGTALQVQGETKFIDVSGLATVPMGSRAVKVRPSRFVTIYITEQTKVLATVQSPGGTLKWVKRNLRTNTFTIILNEPATQDLTVAWFVIS